MGKHRKSERKSGRKGFPYPNEDRPKKSRKSDNHPVPPEEDSLDGELWMAKNGRASGSEDKGNGDNSATNGKSSKSVVILQMSPDGLFKIPPIPPKGRRCVRKTGYTGFQNGLYSSKSFLVKTMGHFSTIRSADTEAKWKEIKSIPVAERERTGTLFDLGLLAHEIVDEKRDYKAVGDLYYLIQYKGVDNMEWVVDDIVNKKAGYVLHDFHRRSMDSYLSKIIKDKLDELTDETGPTTSGGGGRKGPVKRRDDNTDESDDSDARARFLTDLFDDSSDSDDEDY